MKIVPGAKITLTYELFDQEERPVEASESDEPLEVVLGQGDLPPALEKALEGKEAGDRLRLKLPPEEAFGPFDPGALVSVPRDAIPSEELRRGDWIPVELVDEEGEASLEDDQEELEMRVVEVNDDEVILDANHPLAGQEVTFSLEVLAVDAP